MRQLALDAPLLPPVAAEASVPDDRRASRIFVHAGLIASICLQRFCVYIAGSPLYWCLPVFVALAAWMLLSGRAELRPLAIATFGCFVALALVSTLVALNTTDLRINGISLPSLIVLLLLYAALLIRPNERFDGSATLTVFMIYVRLCAGLGIAQYVAQFGGIRIFSFMETVPALRPLLAEPLFNYHPVVAYGSPILRSNGFFLLEPSIFSQLLMLGVLVDVFARGEWRWLPLYGIAYLLSYSGTGLIALVIACGMAIVVAPSTAPRLLIFAVAAAVLAAIAAMIFPSVFNALSGRVNELSYSGTSGYARYVMQIDLFNQVLGETRTLVGYGPGALERATFYVNGSTSPALKLFIDYGLLGLASFAVFIVTALWRRDIALISLYLLVDYQMGGGNLLFMPLVVLAAILCIWSGRVTRPSFLAGE